MRPHSISRLCIIALLFAAGSTPGIAAAAEPEPLRVLFLGDRGHHKPAERSRELIPYLLHRGINVHYTESLDDLSPDNLARYDALMVYANIGSIDKTHEKAIVDYVAGGGGYVPLHCASYCFNNSPRLIKLTGAQFQRHKTGTFRTKIVKPDHPVMKGFAGFESWDETYVHTKHNDDARIILSRRQTDGEDEPWTWVRTHGKGRVFYTAWGHDHRTWTNPGFHDLVERGIRWATGDDKPAATIAKRPVLKSPDPIAPDSKIVYYKPGNPQRGAAEWPWPRPRPMGAEESLKHMITPAGFDVQLFAAEPDIRPALAMAWDERGRLWICESVDYPNKMVEGDGKGNDTIKICEDTDGDGRADKFTVFAEGLSIPTAITFGGGGVIVHQAPHTLLLKDTDGDDKADMREVLYTGWSTGDTHAGPSNLQYGLDNQIWGMVGYAGYNGQVDGERHNFRMGFYRFAPDASKLEFIRSTNNNTWGMGFTEDGLVFGSTANNNPSVYMPIANRHYGKVTGMRSSVLGAAADSPRFLPITPRVRQVDVFWGYTAAAGHAVYTARTYPKDYWNRRAFVTGPTGKLVGTFDLNRNGSDVRTTNPFNLVSSDDEWTGPIMAEVGPDGHVWFIDFYNYIIQHNPTPAGHGKGKGNAYESKQRDKKHARIYRVVWNDAPAAKTLDLSKATPRQLVATLAHDNMLWRKHAQRLLVQRSERDIESALITLIRDTNVDAVGLNVGAIHALWTLHGLGALDDPKSDATAAAIGALKHPSAGVRMNATKVLPASNASAEAVVASGALSDADAQVRLAALLALSDMPASKAAGATIYGMLVEPRNLDDRWIREAATIAGAVHHAGFLAATGTTKTEPNEPPDKLPAGENLFANPGFEKADGDQPAHWATRTYSGDGAYAYLTKGGRNGGRCVKISAAKGTDASWHTTVKVKPGHRYRFSGWVKTEKVATVGGANGALFNVHALPNQPRTTPLKGTGDWRRIEMTFDTGGANSISINCLFGGWGKATGTAYYDDVDLRLIGKSTGTAAANSGSIDGIVKTIEAHAKAAGGGVVATQKLDPKALAEGGDAAKGKDIFWKHELAGCVRCHQVGGQGGVIAPKLDGIAARKDAAYLVRSMIEPNAEIAEGYPGQISPMPPMQLLLSDEEVRDVIAYLKTLK